MPHESTLGWVMMQWGPKSRMRNGNKVVGDYWVGQNGKFIGQQRMVKIVLRTPFKLLANIDGIVWEVLPKLEQQLTDMESTLQKGKEWRDCLQQSSYQEILHLTFMIESTASKQRTRATWGHLGNIVRKKVNKLLQTNEEWLLEILSMKENRSVHIKKKKHFWQWNWKQKIFK